MTNRQFILETRSEHNINPQSIFEQRFVNLGNILEYVVSYVNELGIKKQTYSSIDLEINKQYNNH